MASTGRTRERPATASSAQIYLSPIRIPKQATSLITFKQNTQTTKTKFYRSEFRTKLSQKSLIALRVRLLGGALKQQLSEDQKARSARVIFDDLITHRCTQEDHQPPASAP